jgi:hypothetical protein
MNLLNLTKTTMVASVLGLTAASASVYAYTQHDQLQSTLAQLKRTVDAKGNVTYTVDGKTYVVDPQIKDAAQRAQAVAIQQATEQRMNQLLTSAGHRNTQGVITGPQGESVVTMVGKVVRVQSGELTFDAGAKYGGAYQVRLNPQTIFIKGDQTATPTDITAGANVTVEFYIDQATYGNGLPANASDSIARLQKATKTAYAVALVPYQADDYLAALEQGGIQQQAMPGAPLQHMPDGSAPLIITSP